MHMNYYVNSFFPLKSLDCNYRQLPSVAPIVMASFPTELKLTNPLQHQLLSEDSENYCKSFLVRWKNSCVNPFFKKKKKKEKHIMLFTIVASLNHVSLFVST